MAIAQMPNVVVFWFLVQSTLLRFKKNSILGEYKQAINMSYSFTLVPPHAFLIDS